MLYIFFLSFQHGNTLKSWDLLNLAFLFVVVAVPATMIQEWSRLKW